MRALLVGVMLATFAAAFVGCSKKIEWDPKSTVGYDKSRDGVPTPKAAGKGKKGGGGVAAP